MARGRKQPVVLLWMASYRTTREKNPCRKIGDGTWRLKRARSRAKYRGLPVYVCVPSKRTRLP